MARNVAWGIDIGDSAVKAVRLKRAGDTVVVQDYRTVPCEGRPEEAQTSDKEYRVRNALETLQQDLKLKGGQVVVSMSGRDVFPRFIPLPPVEKKRIPEIVTYEARTQMPFPIEEVIWDYHPLGEAAPGEEIEVGIFAIKKATVYGFLTNLRLAHLVPDVVNVAPLALYNFLTYDRDIEVGTVVIDIGSGTTDLVIVDRERFWIRNVSISSNDITRTLQEKYQISFEEAESLKRKAADSRQAEKLFGTMRPILEDLIGEIQRSIGYYKAQTRNVRIEQVLLLGNAFKLKGLLDHFRTNLDYEVVLLEELQRLRVGSGGDSAKFEAELPNYAVSLGLALQGLGLGAVDIDMMPRDMVRERMLRRKVPFAAAGVGLLALPLLFGFQSVDNELTRVQADVQSLEPRIRSEEQKLGQIKKLRGYEPKAAPVLKEHFPRWAKRSQWVLLYDSINQALRRFETNGIQRGTFVLRAIEEAGDEEDRARPGSRARVGQRPEEVAQQPEGLRVRLVFESEVEAERSEINRLLRLLREDPRLSEASLLRSRQLTESEKGTGASDIWPGRLTYSVEVLVTFDSAASSEG
ncbi:MAG: type IV pilus assembly protein PilM [bacterium]